MDCSNILVVTTSFPNTMDKTSGIFVKKLVDSLELLYPEKIEVIVPGTNNSDLESTPYNVLRVRYLPSKCLKKIHGRGGLPSFIAAHRIALVLLPFLLAALFVSVWKKARSSTLLLANWTFAGVACCVVSSLKGCSTVTILRGSDVNRAEQSMLARLALLVTIRLSAKVVCVSSSLQETLLRLFPKYSRKVIVIENGTEVLDFHPVEMNNRGIITISIVGNLTVNKNISVVLEALARIDSEGSRFRLNVIGDGDELPKLKTRTRELALSSVIFHGPLLQASVIEFLTSSQIYINASYSEGRSNALLEAIQCGCLPVVSRIPGNLTEVTHMETGLVFEPEDPESLVKQLLWIDQNRDSARKLAQNSKSRFSQRSYDWRTCARKYHDLFQTIVR